MPRLKLTETNTLDKALGSFQGAGYVLDFSDRTFAVYFDEEFGIDIDDQRYRINGPSKGKRLRTFLTIEDGNLAGRVLRSLWDHRDAIVARQGSSDNPNLADRYFQIVYRLEGDGGIASTDAIERFSKNETFDELVAAIQRDIVSRKRLLIVFIPIA